MTRAPAVVLYEGSNFLAYARADSKEKRISEIMENGIGKPNGENDPLSQDDTIENVNVDDTIEDDVTVVTSNRRKSKGRTKANSRRKSAAASAMNDWDSLEPSAKTAVPALGSKFSGLLAKYPKIIVTK